jgi:hypothetical protein
LATAPYCFHNSSSSDPESAVEERRFSAALLAEDYWALAPVTPLGLKAGVGGFANAALKGPLFHEASDVRKASGTVKACRHGFHEFARINQNKIKIWSVEIRG